MSFNALSARSSIQCLPQTVGLGVILLLLAIGWFLFPDNLALLTRTIAIALLVLSLDLITGYGGVASLSQAAPFGAGAYAAGIAAVRFGVQDPIAMTLIGILGGAGAGLVSGIVILRGRGLAQLVLSIALIHLFHELANKASFWTGGSDGLSGIAPAPLLGWFEFDLWGRTAYLYGGGILTIAFMLLTILVRSPFGMLCRAIKEDPVRVQSMGAAPWGALLKMFTLAGAVAGAGGALNAISTEVVGLDGLSFTLSAEALVMLVLGGGGSLFGALTGALLFMLLKDFVAAINPFHWLSLMGCLLIGAVLFAPKGIYGGMAGLLTFRKPRS